MTTPEGNFFEQHANAIPEIARRLEDYVELGYRHVAAHNPDPRAANFEPLGMPYGLLVGSYNECNAYFGPSSDVYLHSVTKSGVMQTKRLVLSGPLLYTEEVPTVFKPLPHELDTYLGLGFMPHREGLRLGYGGMTPRQEAAYFEGMEQRLAAYTWDSLQSFYNHALYRYTEDYGAEQQNIHTQTDGTGWLSFTIGLHDELSMSMGQRDGNVTDQIGDLICVVRAEYKDFTETTTGFTITPVQYKTVDSKGLVAYSANPEDTEQYGRPLVMRDPDGKSPQLELPEAYSNRQRALAVSDVNRILSGSQLIIP